MKKRLLTLEDLYNYYSSNSKSSHFSAKNDGDSIVVQVNGKINFEKSDDDIEGLLPVKLAACHDLINLNGSNINKDVMEKALPSFSNRPILGYIHTVDGEEQFYDHRMHLDEEGELVYDEFPIGIIPESCNAHLEYNEAIKKDQVIVDGYIFEEYSKAADILRREEECAVSVELSIRELSYNAKEKYLDIENFFFSGVTILGKNPDGEYVKPGMESSNIKLADFKQKNVDTSFSESNMIGMLEKISDKLDMISNFTIKNTAGKEDTALELVEEMEVTENEEVVVEETMATEEEVTVEMEEATAEEEVTEVEAEAETDEPSEEAVVENDEPKEDSVEFTVTHNGESKTFSVSLNDKLAAMYNLISETYSELDNEWYDINMYDEEKYVEMYGYFTGKNYRQSYKVKNDNYTLIGDRVEVYKKYMTQDEINTLESLKANYAELEQYKASKEAEEAHAERMSVLADYSTIEATDEFKALVENIDSYSVEEISEKADAIVGKYARQGMQFSFEEKKSTAKKIGIVNKEPKNPKSYAGLFD